jgi:hypothetical protein
MKRFILFTIFSALVFILASAAWYVSKLHHGDNKVAPSTVAATSLPAPLYKKVNVHAIAAEQFAGAHQFNTSVCFLIDMSIESGSNRFFVYDMKKDSVLASGLVTHGNCNQNWLAGRKYGNTVGCGCTSLGKYKIGNAYHGKFGLAYKLHGLDATNNNAFSRYVVLHSHACVPESAVDPAPICQSNGCPTVSPGFLQQLAVIINASKKPVLLWMYE